MYEALVFRSLWDSLFAQHTYMNCYFHHVLYAILCTVMPAPSSLLACATSFKAGLTTGVFHTTTSVELENE